MIQSLNSTIELYSVLGLLLAMAPEKHHELELLEALETKPGLTLQI